MPAADPGAAGLIAAGLIAAGWFLVATWLSRGVAVDLSQRAGPSVRAALGGADGSP
jgi:hypothetical protein